MSENYLLDFPINEYKNRVDKLVAKMKENKLDVVILTTSDNLRYYTGYQIIVWESGIAKPAVAVIMSNGEVIMVSGYSNRGMVSASTWIEEHRVWDPLGRNEAITNLPDCIFNVIKERGLQKGNVGMELGSGFRLHLNNEDYNKLVGHLKFATLYDVSKVIWEQRSIKSKLEIEKLKQVCSLNVLAFEKALNSMYDGMNEKDLFKNIAKYMFDLGADSVFPMGIRGGAR